MWGLALSASPAKRTKPMRSVKSLIAAGVASLLSSMAFAADMPSIMSAPMYAPAPVEDFGGWYLRGDIGFSNQSVKKLDWFSYPTLLSLNQNTGFDTAGIFGIGAGYQFNNGLCIPVWLTGSIRASQWSWAIAT